MTTRPTVAHVVPLAVVGLLLALFVCLGGIIYLAAAIPARPIPDILIGTVSLIAGALVGILVPRPTS